MLTSIRRKLSRASPSQLELINNPVRDSDFGKKKYEDSNTESYVDVTFILHGTIQLMGAWLDNITVIGLTSLEC